MTFQNSSGNLSQYNNGGPVGILPGQSMFETDSTRAGLMAARESFVGMMNNIFSSAPLAINNPAAITALTVSSPEPGALIWRQPQLSSDVEPLPPATEWTQEVFDIDQRDALLADPVFVSLVIAGENPRVLVNGLANEDAPQWSVWEASTAALPTGDQANSAYIAANPELVFSLAQAYDFHVASMALRNLLPQEIDPIVVGQRVLVDADPLNNNFWTLWAYDPSNPASDSDGFYLIDIQLYNTTDFWSYVDWFATGYSAANPPVVTYATETARNLNENPNPTSLFVMIENDGFGRWEWTAYDPTTASWSVVAIQNGTIALSPKFYDPSRPVLTNDPLPANAINLIPVRDGSWELKIIFNALQDSSVLTGLQVNELFFSMLHFIHTQQDQVAWAFKTSFMTVSGYNTSLIETPVTPVDNSQNLLDYITEVKPYRVVVRNFTQTYAPPIDNAITHVTDFDFPLFYDTTTDTTRWLSLSNPADLKIIQTQNPWEDWFNNYQNTGLDLNNYDSATWNPTRRFNIQMLFDRVDHMPVLDDSHFTYDGGTNDFSLSLDTTGQLVEVKINGNAITMGYTLEGDSILITDALNIGDDIEVIVRQNITSGYAADRIQQFYDPGLGQPEKNVRQLLGEEFQGDIFDGGLLNETNNEDYETDGNAQSTDPSIIGAGFADPLHNGRPEELIVPNLNESLRIVVFEDQNPQTVTVGNVVVSIPPIHSWAMAQALPASDLMAPSEIGDYDARPLEETSYDSLYAQDIEPDTAGDEKDIYVLRHDAYEYLRWRPTGYLSQNFTATDNSAVITLDPRRTPLPVPEAPNNKPGVVWIGSERIEYFDLNVDEANGVATISQLKRGTHGTGISNEVRTITSAIGDGTTRVFNLTGTANGTVEVIIWQPLVNLAGQPVLSSDYSGFDIPVPKQPGADYSLSIANGNTIVTFVSAPAANAPVFIARTSGLYAPTGSPVYDGTIRYDLSNSSTSSGTPPDDTVTWILPNGETFLGETQTGVEFSVTVQAQDSLGNPITYSVFSGDETVGLPPSALPDGLTLDPVSGVISGTVTDEVPEGGTDYSFALVATSSTGASAISNFDIFVVGPETLQWFNIDTGLATNSVTFTATMGQSFSGSVEIYDNDNFAVTVTGAPNDPIPDFLSVTNDGFISGQLPNGSQNTTYEFILVATSSTGLTANCGIIINATGFTPPPAQDQIKAASSSCPLTSGTLTNVELIESISNPATTNGNQIIVFLRGSQAERGSINSGWTQLYSSNAAWIGWTISDGSSSFTPVTGSFDICGAMELADGYDLTQHAPQIIAIDDFTIPTGGWSTNAVTAQGNTEFILFDGFTAANNTIGPTSESFGVGVPTQNFASSSASNGDGIPYLFCEMIAATYNNADTVQYTVTYGNDVPNANAAYVYGIILSNDAS